MIRHQIIQTNQEKTRPWNNLSFHEMPPNQVNPKDALAMYGVRMRMPDAPMLRRCFHAMVAMFQASHNCGYYITKDHAKPMEQLQSLVVNIALGLRRLAAEDEATESAAVVQPEERARKVTLKIASAANRSSWFLL